jgi:very-short-patch-repair endonuclease
MKINNLKSLEQYRKNLRNNSTSAEATLWKLLKSSQPGKKFRRQHSVGPFIIDFYCAVEKLAVELDGQHHFTPEGYERDEKRTAYLKKFGIRVIRFENREVFEATDAVLETIKRELHSQSAT